MANTYKLPTHIKGDTFGPVTFEILVNGTPLDLTGATAKMWKVA
jgi:hypothetical protein